MHLEAILSTPGGSSSGVLWTAALQNSQAVRRVLRCWELLSEGHNYSVSNWIYRCLHNWHGSSDGP